MSPVTLPTLPPLPQTDPAAQWLTEAQFQRRMAELHGDLEYLLQQLAAAPADCHPRLLAWTLYVRTIDVGVAYLRVSNPAFLKRLTHFESFLDVGLRQTVPVEEWVRYGKGIPGWLEEAVRDATRPVLDRLEAAVEMHLGLHPAELQRGALLWVDRGCAGPERT